MPVFSRYHAVFWLLLLLSAAVIYVLQMHIYIHKDVAYILHESAVLLQGGTYGKDIFEPNPPLILYLNLPVVWLTHLTGWDILAVFRLYTLSCCFLSCLLCSFLINKLFKRPAFCLWINCVVAFSLFVLPAHQFGQREQFLMILILPYLFSCGLRLQNIKLNLTINILIGLMAGVGFAIKPHFLTALVLIESYLIFNKKSLYGWIRTESLIILSFLIAYLTLILVYFPNYLRLVYPLWWPHFVAVKYSNTQVALWTYPHLLFCGSAIILYYVLRQTDQYPAISKVFLLATIGFVITFIQPGVTWYYHILPALICALLLIAILLGQSFEKITMPAEKIFLVVLTTIFFAIPLSFSIYYLKESVYFFTHPNNYAMLIDFLKKSAPNNSFVYLSDSHDLIILENYANATYVSPFPSLWWYYDLTLIKYRPSIKAIHYARKQIPYLENFLNLTLANSKPQFIIMDTAAAAHAMKLDLNFMTELAKSANYKNFWQSYTLTKTIANYDIYTRI